MNSITGSKHRTGHSKRMEKYLFVTKMHTSNPKILQRKSILTVSEDSA